MQQNNLSGALTGMLVAAAANWARYDDDTQRRLRNIRNDAEAARSAAERANREANAVADYLARLQTRLKEMGAGYPVFMIHSGGGLISVETAAEFFTRRAEGRTGSGLGRILDMVPNRPPEPGDELPEGWTPDRLRHN